VLFVAEGKDAGTVEAFAKDLAAHGGNPKAIAEVCIDMSPAFIAGIAQSLPNAQITFDKIPPRQAHQRSRRRGSPDRTEEPRRTEEQPLPLAQEPAQPRPAPGQALSERQRTQLSNLSGSNLKTGRAYRIRLAFQELYAQPARNAAVFLKKWYWWATHSRLPPMIEAARMVKRHWNGILRWFHSKIANGIMEAINSLVQAAKAKARGYRSTRNLRAIIYLIAGKLELALPT
jgi:transposase